MENETGNTRSREEMVVSYYFTDALKYYVEHQTEIFENLPEQQKPKSSNMITLELLEGIIEGLSEEKVGYEAVLRATFHNAKASSRWLKVVGVFYCGHCGAKDVIPMEVKTSRDGMSYIKNGSFNYELYQEYKNTEEIVSMNLIVPENLAPDCRCKDRGEDNFMISRTSFGIQLSDKDVQDLQKLIEKENKRPKRISWE